MNRLASFGAILRKDLLILWPMVLFAVGLPVLGRFLPEASEVSNPLLQLLLGILPVLTAVISVVLAFSVVHQDAPPSLRHDWLTRPIRRIDLAAAKLLFMFAFVAAPWLANNAIGAVQEGYSIQEWLLEASGNLAIVGLLLILLAIASVTATMVEAIAVTIAIIVLMVVTMGPWPQLVLGPPSGVIETGAGWMVANTLLVLLLAGCMLVLWLQYGRRMTGAARAVIAASVPILAIIASYTPWAPVYAAQESLAPQPKAQEGVRLAVPAACFHSAVIPGFRTGSELEREQARAEFARRTGFSPQVWTTKQMKDAGPNPVAFSAPVEITGLEPGGRVIVDRIRASLVDKEGRTVRPLARSAARVKRREEDLTGGAHRASYDWLVSRSDLEGATARGERLRFDYAVTVLEPGRSYQFPAGPERRWVKGLGYCGESPEMPGVVDCLLVGRKPDSGYVQALGVEGGECIDCGRADYGPKLPIGGDRRTHRVRLRPGAKPTGYKLTTYEAQAHFQQAVYAAAPLGAPNCPLPTSEPTAAASAPAPAPEGS